MSAGGAAAGPALKDGLQQQHRLGSVRPAAGDLVCPFQGQEAVGGGDEGAVVVEPKVAAAFVVVQAEFALELLVVELDHPGQPGEAREALGFGVGRQIADPVVGRLVAASGHSTISHSSRGAWRSRVMGWAAITRTNAKRETSFWPSMSRKATVCKASW